ncbi:MAG: RagB/SusD family nutrient uptake outer membrane protein [bacterium]
MKKLIKNISFLFFVATFLFGCQEDFLERAPLDEISSETFWNTENDLMVYNNNLYNRAKNDGNIPIMMGHTDSPFNSHWASLWFQDGFTDDAAPENPRHDNFNEVRAGIHQVQTGPRRFGYSNWHFVRAINIGLENYDRADIPQSTINMYAGEARLFRGWFYADKVSKFGDVPWLDKELNVDSPELYGPRTPREEAMENVLADLQFAAEHLPADRNWGGDPGRLNKYCALAVLSRVALFEGTWRKYHGGTDPDRWIQIAADAALELMESGVYEIYTTGDPTTDYRSWQNQIDMTGNPEVIYWRKYISGIVNNQIQGYYNGYHGGHTKDFVEDYLDTDGLPIRLSNLYQGDAMIEDVFENRDPRMRQTILHPDDESWIFEGTVSPGALRSWTGYRNIKFFNQNQQGRAFGQQDLAAITLRYAEVLLNYAEAKAELGTLTQADLDMSINLLRDRVGMPHMDINNIPVDPKYIPQWHTDPLIIEIRRERRIEMASEGLRYNDIRRWKWGKKLEQPDLGFRWDAPNRERYFLTDDDARRTTIVDGVEYIEAYQGTDYANPVFDESKHYLWPIPLNDLSQNPEIGQNPGWD